MKSNKVKANRSNRRRQIAAIIAGLLALLMILGSAAPFFFNI